MAIGESVGFGGPSTQSPVPKEASADDKAKFEKSLTSSTGGEDGKAPSGETPASPAPGGYGESASPGGAVSPDQAAPHTGARDQTALGRAPNGEASAYGQAADGAASNEAAASDGEVSAEKAPTPEEEAAFKAFQQKSFASFAGEVDQETQERLSEWLPDFLGGDNETLDKKRLELTKEQADDLRALADKMGIDATFGAEAILGGAVSVYTNIALSPDSVPVNLEAIQQLQQRFGEHTLKEATPGLAPSASYDTENTLDATKDNVYEEFVSGLDEETKASLATWLPGALDDRSLLPNSPNDEQGAGLHAIAVKHGFGDADALQRSVVEAYDRALALETAAELPTVVDLMLVRHDGEYSKDVAFEINVAGDNIAARVELYEGKGFGELDAWLPDALAGKGGIPTGDAEAMAKLGEFAEFMGMEGGADATPEAAFDFIEQSDVFDKALHEGATGDKAYLLFSDKFLDNTIDYGAKNGAVTDDIRADAAATAELLLGPDDGSSAPRPFDSQALTAAVLHRTDTPLDRPQELQAASGYINKAETLAEQKERVADALVAFHVREEVGTGPMTPRQWAEAFTEVSPEIVGKLNERAFNNPTSEKMQIITQHLGVPGDHEFMIDEKRKIQISNDELGNVTSFDQDKKKKDKLGKILDIAVPVVATALTFTGWGAGVGMALNAGYSAYKGAMAIKEGDLLGGALSIAGAIPGGGALGAVAKGARIASAGLQAHRAAENGDLLGALTSGLGGVAMAGGGQGFQTAATGINTAEALKEGDLLEAGAGFASLAGDATEFSNGSKDLGFAFEGIEHGLELADGIQEENFAAIGGAASGLLQTGHDFHEHRQEQAELEELKAQLQAQQGAGGRPGAGGIQVLDENGDPIVIEAGFAKPTDGPPVTVEVAGGDTLSQIAERHGTTVDELLAANPEITDPNQIHAGQELTLPEGVQPVGDAQQNRLNDFANVNGDSRGVVLAGMPAGAGAIAGPGSQAGATLARILAGGAAVNPVGVAVTASALILSPSGQGREEWEVPGFDNLRFSKHDSELAAELEYQDVDGNWQSAGISVSPLVENGEIKSYSVDADTLAGALQDRGFTIPDGPDTSLLPGTPIDPQKPSNSVTLPPPDLSTDESLPIQDLPPVDLSTPIPDEKGLQILESRNNKADGKLTQLGLPTTGDVTFDPQKNQRANDIRKLSDGAFRDQYDNDWKWDPTKQEWDVTLSPKGKRQYGHLSKGRSHLNVSSQGKITH